MYNKKGGENMLKKCIECGNDIPRGNMSVNNKKYQSKKFCSNTCHHKSMKIEFKYNCTECGNIINRTKEGITTNIYCNDICKGRYLGKNYSTKKTENPLFEFCCEMCGKKELVIFSRKSRRFCSSNCRAKYFSKKITISQQDRITVNCNHCLSSITRKKSSINTLNFCDIDCMRIYYTDKKLFSGEKSGTWNGGKKHYKGKNWLSQRRKARERDNYTCQKCGITEEEYGMELSVHHIIPFVLFEDFIEANKDDNLTSVCEPCHRKIHSGDNHPSKFFKTNSVGDIV